MRWHLLGLWRDTSGASVIETAFIVPILALLACGGADVGLGFAEKLRAQQGADRAVQFALNVGLTGATQTGIQNEAATGSGLSAANVTVNFWLECNKVVQSNFNGICTVGTPARYVSVTVADSYQPQFTRLFAANPISLQGFAEGRIQ
jgi:Flp pilus assembly protein TadG